jgi:hypothetical protein
VQAYGIPVGDSRTTTVGLENTADFCDQLFQEALAVTVRPAVGAGDIEARSSDRHPIGPDDQEN